MPVYWWVGQGHLPLKSSVGPRSGHGGQKEKGVFWWKGIFARPLFGFLFVHKTYLIKSSTLTFNKNIT